MKAWTVYPPQQQLFTRERRHEVVVADSASFANGVVAFIVDGEPIRILAADRYEEVVALGSINEEELARAQQVAQDAEATHAAWLAELRRMSGDQTPQ